MYFLRCKQLRKKWTVVIRVVKNVPFSDVIPIEFSCSVECHISAVQGESGNSCPHTGNPLRSLIISGQSGNVEFHLMI